MRVRTTLEVRFILSLLFATGVGICLLVAESTSIHYLAHGYMVWNIFLAWIPFVLSLWLRQVLKHKLWSSWSALSLSLAWLLFLPNSFYMISDFIHLNEIGNDEILLSALMFASFILTGVILGFASLYITHREMLRRVTARAAAVMVGLILFTSSFAIYIGRDLRWNSWDILFNPFGLLFDLSERLLHPSQYPQVLLVVLPFFAILSSMYVVVWNALRLARAETKLIH